MTFSEAVDIVQILKEIKAKVPLYVYNNLFSLLTSRESSRLFTYFMLIVKVMNHELSDFQYLMDANDNEDTVTPVREMLDLLDGYIFYTEFSIGKDQLPRWIVYEIKDEE